VDFAARRTTESRLLPSANHRYQSSAAHIGQNGPWVGRTGLKSRQPNAIWSA
jgi:hypothetical protein